LEVIDALLDLGVAAVVHCHPREGRSKASISASIITPAHLSPATIDSKGDGRATAGRDVSSTTTGAISTEGNGDSKGTGDGGSATTGVAAAARSSAGSSATTSGGSATGSRGSARTK
jgi:hypothetical protein